MVEVTDMPPKLAKKSPAHHRGGRRPDLDPRRHPPTACREPRPGLQALGRRLVLVLTEAPGRLGRARSRASISVARPAGPAWRRRAPQLQLQHAPGACPVCDGLGVRPQMRRTRRRSPTDDEVPCPACGGSRLRPEALAVQHRRRDSSTSSARCAFSDLLGFFRSWHPRPALEPVATPIVREIDSRLRLTSSTPASSTCRSAGAPTRFPAASSSGLGWPRSSARGWSASARSSTSQRPAFTRVIPPG